MSTFEHWWNHVGSQAPERGDDMYEHCKRMCKMAWETSAAAQVQEFACSTGLCHYKAQPAVPLTDGQIDAAVKAWFENEIVAGRQPFAKRMRAAIEATHDIKRAA